MVAKLRLILCFELIAYYFAAPYIILLALDDKRGIFDAMTSAPVRFWGYVLLLGLYPMLQSIISPYIGRCLDQKESKVSVLRNIHLANTLCYLMLGLGAYFHSLALALAGLAIPGFTGCLAPVGKSLISSLTDPELRVQEFAKIAVIKGAVKLVAPLLGVFVFECLLDKSGYTPLFCISSAFSLCCFLFTFTFSNTICSYQEPAAAKPTYSLFISFVKNNFTAVCIFISLLLGSTLIVRFTPVVFRESLREMPSLVNYFSSCVGLSYAINQLITWRFAKKMQQFLPLLFILLCSSVLFFCITTFSPLWFLSFFIMLFCFSVLSTYTEARLSLLGVAGTQGTRQGILYSIENWSYIGAPLLGGALVSLNVLYPVYFVLFLALVAFGFYALSSRSQPEAA